MAVSEVQNEGGVFLKGKHLGIEDAFLALWLPPASPHGLRGPGTQALGVLSRPPTSDSQASPSPKEGGEQLQIGRGPRT